MSHFWSLTVSILNGNLKKNEYSRNPIIQIIQNRTTFKIIKNSDNLSTFEKKNVFTYYMFKRKRGQGPPRVVEL